MNILWKINRWYDDLDKTNPVKRFVYFLSFIVTILLIPTFWILITGHDSGIATAITWILLFAVLILRIIWLRKNNAL